MAITAYTGLPGSGKSYGVVANVLRPAFESGRTIVTNVALNMDAVLEQYPEAEVDYQPDLGKFTGEQLCAIVNGALIVIDEVWSLFPSGMTAKNAGSELQSFLTEHRHRVEDGQGQDIVFITQDLQQICAFARNLVDKTYRATKLDALGEKNRFKIEIYQGAVTGQNPPQRLLINKQLGQYKPEVYALYKSHTKGDGSVGSESDTDGRANMGGKIKLFIVLGIAVALVAAVFSFRAFAGIFGGSDDIERTPTIEQVENQGSKLASLSPRQSGTYSKSWRVVGLIDRRIKGFRNMKVVVSNGNHSHVIPKKDNCEYDDMELIECVFLGELVTKFTGKDADFIANSDRSIGHRVAASTGW